ncbi:MAG: Ig domain-containing protein, partial [Pseudomonas sp.]
MGQMTQGVINLAGASESVLNTGRSAAIGIALLALLLVMSLAGCGLTTNSAAKQVPNPSLADLKISTSTLPAAQVQGSYQTSLAASGGKAPYTWTVASGALPNGISLTGATGTISGKPSQSGTFAFDIRVQDSSSPLQTANAALTIAVSTTSTLQITTTSL